MTSQPSVRTFPEALLRDRVIRTLTAAGARPADAAETARALLHASARGTDSHGVRLTGHYAALLRSGGINPNPDVTLRSTGPASATISADHSLAHPVAYRAMNEAVSRARTTGIAAVSVADSTHFGAAGAFAAEAAAQGMIGIVTSNSDSVVCLFGGKGPFHGTNPLAMATSSIPFNRVKLYRSLDKALPPGTAIDQDGHPTTSAQDARFLQPLGGEDFGFKGAALAGIVTILSALLTGADADDQMAATDSDQTATHRQNVGHFFIAINPDNFIGREAFGAAITRYLTALRNSPSADPAHPVMAPGDRARTELQKRREHGIPVDPDTQKILGLT